MRIREKSHLELPPEELARMEAEAHDEDYTRLKAADTHSLTVDVDHFWRMNDHCYKRGTYIRGFRKKRLFELMGRDLAGLRILDAGCGAGGETVLLACSGAEHVSGFDLSKVGVELGEERAAHNGVGDRCDFQSANCADLPFDDESFDVVVCNAFVHHVIKYAGAASELRRVLRPGGRLLIADGLRQNPLYRLGRWTYRKLRPNPKDDLGDVDLDKEDLYKFCDGLDIEVFEHFCGVEAIKYVVRARYDVGPIARVVLRCAVAFDRLIFTVFPFLKRYCSGLS